LRSGMCWRDMPERYGKYKTTHKRFTRWAATGVWDRIFADLLKDRENRVCDDLFERRSRSPASCDGAKKGLRRPLWGGVEEV